jgi:branched-subunit amino acid transport protein
MNRNCITNVRTYFDNNLPQCGKHMKNMTPCLPISAIWIPGVWGGVEDHVKTVDPCSIVAKLTYIISDTLGKTTCLSLATVDGCKIHHLADGLSI